MTAQPTTPTPRPAPKPRPSSPWDNPITIPPIPNYVACCELSAGGDWCDCAAFAAEAEAAFRRPIFMGRAA